MPLPLSFLPGHGEWEKEGWSRICKRSPWPPRGTGLRVGRDESGTITGKGGDGKGLEKAWWEVRKNIEEAKWTPAGCGNLLTLDTTGKESRMTLSVCNAGDWQRGCHGLSWGMKGQERVQVEQRCTRYSSGYGRGEANPARDTEV